MILKTLLAEIWWVWALEWGLLGVVRGKLGQHQARWITKRRLVAGVADHWQVWPGENRNLVGTAESDRWSWQALIRTSLLHLDIQHRWYSCALCLDSLTVTLLLRTQLKDMKTECEVFMQSAAQRLWLNTWFCFFFSEKRSHYCFPAC